ncbi:MAG: hypothetical protein JO002_16815 [Burkholderiaceae bacterium]|nr:hypothetical protein [Burkholderiaceae bacterium]
MPKESLLDILEDLRKTQGVSLADVVREQIDDITKARDADFSWKQIAEALVIQMQNKGIACEIDPNYLRVAFRRESTLAQQRKSADAAPRAKRASKPRS